MATPIRAFSRYVTEKVELGGVVIPEGARVIAVFASANRDGEVFAEPDRFDVTRNTRKHLGFGHGVHACMGMHLARREMINLIGAMLPLLKRWNVTGTPEIAMNNTIRAFKCLPMEVERA